MINPGQEIPNGPGFQDFQGRSPGGPGGGFCSLGPGLRFEGIPQVPDMPIWQAKPEITLLVDGNIQQADLSHRALRGDRQHALKN